MRPFETFGMKRLTSSQDVDIQPADPAARKRAIWVFLLVVVLLGGPVAILEFNQDRLDLWFRENSIGLASRIDILFLSAFILMLPLVGAAVFVFRTATRIIKAERIPFPGQAVIKDTPIITGTKAVRRGRALQVMAALMGIFGLLMPFGLAVIVMLLQKGI